MMTLEAKRRAARPLRRYEPQPTGLSLRCLRCDREFQSPVIAGECWNCSLAGARLYGSHLTWEMSGA